MGNTFGHLFRVTTFGESHGPAVGAVVDGCPPLLEMAEADLQAELDRRRPQLILRDRTASCFRHVIR